MRGGIPRRRSRPGLPSFAGFAPNLDPLGEGTEMRCVLHTCVACIFIGTLSRREKTILGKLAIEIRVRHDTPEPLNVIESLNVINRPPNGYSGSATVLSSLHMGFAWRN